MKNVITELVIDYLLVINSPVGDSLTDTVVEQIEDEYLEVLCLFIPDSSVYPIVDHRQVFQKCHQSYGDVLIQIQSSQLTMSVTKFHFQPLLLHIMNILSVSAIQQINVTILCSYSYVAAYCIFTADTDPFLFYPYSASISIPQ